MSETDVRDSMIQLDYDEGFPHFFRFAVAHFGVRTTGNLFHALRLISPLVRKYRRKGVRLILWVDDVLIIVPNTCSTPFTCPGSPDCAECQTCKEVVMTLDEEFSQDLTELGFETNKKDVRASKSSKFLGIVFDTHTMTFRVELDADALFGERCVDILRTDRATPRDMTRLVGLLNWWSITCWGAKFMSRSIQSQSTSCTVKEQWDSAVSLNPTTKEELAFWRDHVVTVVSFGMPILVPRYDEMLRMWNSGEEPVRGHRPKYRLVSDGGPLRWGSTLKSWPVKGAQPPVTVEREGSGEYPTDLVQQGCCDHQSWREAIAALLSLKTFTPIIAGSVVLHLSDCTYVVKVLQEGGSTTSAHVHRWAVEIWRWCAQHGIILVSGWALGHEVVRLGSDRLSREAGEDTHGYTAGPVM